MGLNGTIFAYGQTGAGKTYSIIGGDQVQKSAVKNGILPRTLEYVFSKFEQDKMHVSVSFFEIYNEKIYDLLNAQSRKP